MVKKIASTVFVLCLLYGSGLFWSAPCEAGWMRTYGGTASDDAYFVRQTSDGGYIVAGQTPSFGAGDMDAWLLKLDGEGDIVWQKTYGGTDFDSAYSVQQTSDGGYIVGGQTRSFGAGDQDVWVLKLSANGDMTWQKTYGGTAFDFPNLVQQTSDGGFIVVGGTRSFGAGDQDAWVLKLDENGSVTWQKTLTGQPDRPHRHAMVVSLS